MSLEARVRRLELASAPRDHRFVWARAPMHMPVDECRALAKEAVIGRWPDGDFELDVGFAHNVHQFEVFAAITAKELDDLFEEVAMAGARITDNSQEDCTWT